MYAIRSYYGWPRRFTRAILSPCARKPGGPDAPVGIDSCPIGDLIHAISAVRCEISAIKLKVHALV